MRISDWSSDVCSSDLFDLALAHLDRVRIGDVDALAVEGFLDPVQHVGAILEIIGDADPGARREIDRIFVEFVDADPWRRLARGARVGGQDSADRSEEHTSELQSLMRSSYAVFC